MSNTTRFIADPHFGHENMAKNRGFKDASEQDAFIVKQWNERVGKNDTTYILGDVSMEKSAMYPILSKLNGKKYVILGNHDKRQHVPTLLEYVDGVLGMLKKRFRAEEVTAFLTHSPIHPREFRRGRINLNIHGHIHEYKVKKWFGLVEDTRYICVSCEQVDYTPRTLKELLDEN
jgi:calcineurin-like phosphoesterase family protein